MGRWYRFGIGVAEQDDQEAFKWYKKAAELGNEYAQSEVALMYYTGKGVEQDDREAFKWSMKAAEQGYAISQSCVGDSYSEGKGVEQDYCEAFKWYMKAAEQGEETAQFGLGNLYSEGKGVEQDYQEALKWYKKSADKFAAALNIVGDFYNEGKGVEKDAEEAYKWYEKASLRGYAKREFLTAQKDFGEWLTAAREGDVKAQYHMGETYSKGINIEENAREAIKWYTRAAENGYIEAQIKVGEWYLYKNNDEAVKWYKKLPTGETN